ncbi:MAG TPA: histidine--tRNA ligase [Vicinamibacteria bacterium]|nr:histidine--tRNA ligase [Vicinamibacteria bacterium]
MQSLKGFRDFFPEEMAERTYLFDSWRRVARRFGFVEFDGPPLELLELYTRKSGDEIVGQLYNFQDRGGREVALRPEMTPTLARMVAARAPSLPKPLKWFSIPQLFRQEKNQRGRLREHFQLNVDIVGSPAIEADAELLSVALEVMRELGLAPEDVVARVNDRRIISGVLGLLGISPKIAPAVYAVVDKFRKVPAEVFSDLLAEAGVERNAALQIQGLCDRSVNLFEWCRSQPVDETTRRVVSDLERYLEIFREAKLGQFVETDFSIVRGLAYYTGIVFELYDRKGVERAICGGGRYDDLVASFGGPKLPALGFGMGDVVLTLMLRDRGLLPAPAPRVEVVVIPVGGELQSAARQVTNELRSAGLPTETPFEPAGVGKDLKAASRDRARFAVIVGPEEWQVNEATLKDLGSGEQYRVPIRELASRIRDAQ